VPILLAISLKEKQTGNGAEKKFLPQN